MNLIHDGTPLLHHYYYETRTLPMSFLFGDVGTHALLNFIDWVDFISLHLLLMINIAFSLLRYIIFCLQVITLYQCLRYNGL